MRVYDQSDFSPFIERGLPGCTWNVEARQKATPSRDAKTSKLSCQLIEYLDTYEGDRISVRALKTGTGLDEVHPKTFPGTGVRLRSAE